MQPRREERLPLSGSRDVNNEYWMPTPASEPFDNGFLGYQLLTPEEQAVLRRLRRGSSRLRKAHRGASGIRHRAALRRRRKALDNLRISDLRSLVQIVMELGL
jgi:hypothetical protein